MKIAEHLSSQDKNELQKVKKQAEKLSEKDLRDLMGSNRDTFKRVNGAIRKK